ncbi:MAG: hypothetical protein R6V51_01735 [Dehalococcoidia bacterium]
MTNYVQEISDLELHAKKQGLMVDSKQMYCTFKKTYESVIGKNKDLSEKEYLLEQQKIHNLVMNLCWDVVDSKAKYESLMRQYDLKRYAD